MKKRMLSMLLSAGLMMGLITPVFAAETYEVPVKLMNYHEPAKESMANKALKPTAVAVVDGEMTEIQLAFKPMEMSGAKENINKLFALNGTEKTEAKKETVKGAYDVLATFKVKEKKPATVDLAFWINAMDKLQGGTPGAGEQKAKLSLNWTQAKQISDKVEKPAIKVAQKADKNAIEVSVKGEKVVFSKAPINQKGSVVVPFRESFKALGADIVWHQGTKTAIAKKDGVTLSLTLSKKTATKEVNGKKEIVKLQAPAQLIDNSIYIPLRFIGEGFGNTVTYQKTATGGVVEIN